VRSTGPFLLPFGTHSRTGLKLAADTSDRLEAAWWPATQHVGLPILSLVVLHAISYNWSSRQYSQPPSIYQMKKGIKKGLLQAKEWGKDLLRPSSRRSMRSQEQASTPGHDSTPARSAAPTPDLYVTAPPSAYLESPIPHMVPVTQETPSEFDSHQSVPNLSAPQTGHEPAFAPNQDTSTTPATDQDVTSMAVLPIQGATPGPDPLEPETPAHDPLLPSEGTTPQDTPVVEGTSSSFDVLRFAMEGGDVNLFAPLKTALVDLVKAGHSFEVRALLLIVFSALKLFFRITGAWGTSWLQLKSDFLVSRAWRVCATAPPKGLHGTSFSGLSDCER